MTLNVTDLDAEAQSRLALALVRAGHLDHGLRLVAHVETALAPDDLRAHITTLLPSYMVPDQIIAAQTLPRLPNGKLDRTALAKPSPPTKPQKTAAPNEALDLLRTIWAQTLGIEQIHDTDDFFEMGGDSLLSISVVSRARSAGLNILPSDLFDYPKLQDLAAQVTLDQGQALSDVDEGPVDLSRPARDTVLGQIVLINATRRIIEHLEDALGGRYQIHLLTLHWDSGEVSTRASVQDIAQEYLDRVRACAPTGPYLLGGYSFGGVVAMEVARHLQSMGEDVDNLLLIDPPENPDLFLEVRNETHTYVVPQDEIITLKHRLANQGAALLSGIYGTLGLALPMALRKRVAQSAYFNAAAKYRATAPVAALIIVGRKRNDRTSMWAKEGEYQAILDVDCEHKAFYLDDATMREWTGKLAAAIQDKNAG